jgi:hypothetical protein
VAGEDEWAHFGSSSNRCGVGTGTGAKVHTAAPQRPDAGAAGKPAGLGDPRRISGFDDDIRACSVDDRLQLGLFFGGNGELVERLLEVIHEGVPLRWGDLQLRMRLRHGFAGIFLRAARGPADHLGHQDT